MVIATVIAIIITTSVGHQTLPRSRGKAIGKQSVRYLYPYRELTDRLFRLCGKDFFSYRHKVQIEKSLWISIGKDEMLMNFWR